MAVNPIKEKTTLKLELDNGIVDGKQLVKSKNYNKVKTTATDEELYNTAVAIAGLQSRDLLKVKRIEEITLIEE